MQKRSCIGIDPCFQSPKASSLLISISKEKTIMAEGNEKKFLDGGGLQRVWDKIKEYLTNWKTSGFGSGTYNNTGSIENAGKIKVGSEHYTIQASRADMEVGGGFLPLYYDCEIYTLHGLRVIPCARGQGCMIRIINKSGEEIRPWILSFHKETSENLNIDNPTMSAHAPSMWLSNDTTTVLEAVDSNSQRGAALLVW